MKRKFSYLIVSLCLLGSSLPVLATTSININGVNRPLSSELLSQNNITYIPLREVGNLLNLNTNYDESTKIITISYEDKTLTIDSKQKDTVAVVKDNITYLPLRYISENLGFDINYSNGIISINTDKDTETEINELPTELDISKMNPADPTNPHNLLAFKAGRSLSVMPLASWDKIQKPAGVNQKMWDNMMKVSPNGAVLVKGKLSDMPEYLNNMNNGKEDFNTKFDKVPRIGVNNKGVLKSSRGGAPTYIYFKDGSFVQVDFGADASIGKDFNGNYFPGKGLKDIACISIADTQAAARYILFVTGE